MNFLNNFTWFIPILFWGNFIKINYISKSVCLLLIENYKFYKQIWIKRNNGSNEPEVLLKSYDLAELPKKYYSFYVYAKQVIDIIRGKTPTAKILNEDGKFSLMQNANPPCFEAIFQENSSKVFKVVHVLSTTLFKIFENNSAINEIDLEKKNTLPPNEHMMMITKSLYYLHLCNEKTKDKASLSKKNWLN